MPGVCRYYNTLNGCRFGDRCRYEHVPTTRRSIANGSAPCHFFRSKKGCRYGNSCHFSHEQSNTRLAPTSAPPPSATAMDEEAAADAEPPVAAEAAAMPAEDASIDNSKAVVLYDPEVAEANLLKAARSRKRKPGTELQMAQCSQCKKSFSSAATPEESCLALRDHYVEKLGKVDQKHVRFFNENYELSETVYCIICERSFQQYRGLFRHMRAKMLNKKDPKSADDHKAIFEEIVQPFVDRDTGYEMTEDDIICSIMAFMTEDDDFDDYGFSSDDYDEDEDGAGLLFAMGLAQALRNRNNGVDLHDDDDDEDDDEYGEGMLGFTGSECFELLCQGVKPWDEDAGAVMAALNGQCYW